jgi:hypothetical protein
MTCGTISRSPEAVSGSHQWSGLVQGDDAASGSAFGEQVAVALGDDDAGVVEQPIDGRGDRRPAHPQRQLLRVEPDCVLP